MRYSQTERNFIRQYLGEWGDNIPYQIRPIVQRYAIDRFNHAVRMAYYKPLIKFMYKAAETIKAIFA
jgi:hypothetical protein